MHDHEMGIADHNPGLGVIDLGTALGYCRDRIRHFKEKADHNKREALRLFQLLIVCTLGAPLFITLGTGMLWGKIVPSILSTVATGCAVWLQQRRPQQLWTLYRTMQRRLEFEEVNHRFKMNDYEDTDDLDKVLASKTAEICATAHDLWVPLTPNPDRAVSAMHPGKPASTSTSTTDSIGG